MGIGELPTVTFASTAPEQRRWSNHALPVKPRTAGQTTHCRSVPLWRAGVQYLEIRPEFDVDFRSVVTDDLHLVCGSALILAFHFANPALTNTRQGCLACFVPVSGTEARIGVVVRLGADDGSRSRPGDGCIAGLLQIRSAQGLIIAGRADSGGNCGSSQRRLQPKRLRRSKGLSCAWRSLRYLPTPALPICVLIICSQYSAPTTGVPGLALSANSLRE
jgi:hypothetical protein